MRRCFRQLAFVLALALTLGSAAAEDESGARPGVGQLKPPDVGFPNPWKPTTVPRDPTCATGCVEYGPINMTHGGPMKFYVQPDVDDALAQWADCVESMQACLKRTDFAVSACMAEALCPRPCKDRYASIARAETDTDTLLDVFQEVFLDRDAVCAPRESVVVRP